jgi:hypothetical protein
MKLLLAVFFALLFMGCKKTEQAQNKNFTTISCDSLISYNNRVKAIFVSNCAASGCHDGVDLPSLSEYNVARDASQQIRTAVANRVMPKNSTLSNLDRATIVCWIDSGAKSN